MLLKAGKDLRFCEYDMLSYWAPISGGTEVDFVLERGKEKFAIEVKTAKEPSNSHLKSLHAISGLKGFKRKILVYPGVHDRTTIDGIEILSLNTFFKQVAGGL